MGGISAARSISEYKFIYYVSVQRRQYRITNTLFSSMEIVNEKLIIVNFA